MSEHTLIVFFVFLFIAAVLLSQTVLIGASGLRADRSRLLKRKLIEIEQSESFAAQESLIRKSYLDSLSPLERKLESLPFCETLSEKLSFAGLKWKSYKVIISLTLLSVTAMLATLFVFKSIPIALAIPVILVAIFYFWLKGKIEKRLNLFEEQFVEALEVMRRALIVGYPFTEVMKTVSEEMPSPIAEEFGKVYIELSYGVDLKVSLANFAHRNPTISVMAFNSAVIIQKETGGNLSETLDKLSNVIRGRFRLLRKVRSVSAEGRLSAKILMMVPFGLFIMLYFTTPGYLDLLFESPVGLKLLATTGILMTLGLIWINRILNIEV
ncbi:type II secretion system F family protein [Thaumasiovibrio sp. DFM-14]|uniref:type II secretion system F family protein n=1 Tax=Thaumasiovibrio sp. DFM-14 TaxID=3384792 RepID=UPI0039A0A421